VVLVRPGAAGEWYVQPPPELNERGYFKTTARFGNDKTAVGQKFQVAVVIIRSPEELEFFRGKEVLPMVPDSLARSEVIPVTLGDTADRKEPDGNEAAGKKEAAVPTATLLSPAADAVVKTKTRVAGRVSGKAWPVVLVRSDDPNESWWVQGPLELNSMGEFTCMAHFGSDKTPGGKPFRVIVLLLPDEKGASALPVGLALAQLPADVPRSAEIVVTRDQEEAPAAKGG
jgi:hypothetical protein